MMTLALIILLVLQQLFWSITCHRLVNKLMCRNYFEYQQAEQAFAPKPKMAFDSDPEEDLGVLTDVGGMI